MPSPQETAVVGEDNPIAKGSTQSPGDQMDFTSLSAAFKDNHQVYYDLLVRAIDADGVKNVAITGAYGTGKSSILAKLQEKRGGNIVQLSLSTIATPDRDADAARGEHPADATNLIQKEVVKQLLYRLPPNKTPRSRFRRASKARHGLDWLVAGVVGAVVIGVPFLLGLVQPVVERVVPGPAVRWWATYALLVALAAAVVWAIRRLVTGRVAMSASLETGLTTVNLSEKSDTYFDEYLDEIVYFFQASGVQIVVIEDIDRFKDVQVFDTLRALNGLLNSAGGLSRIVFVYAIRDSVFERIGDVSNKRESSDPAERAIELESRTKFFDVIIPVVPFLNADNARDLMSRVMTSPKFTISPSLIRTAARHTADMRLIHNIRNEFEVYHNQLVAPDDHLYGIDDDLVFTMVLYKNTHLGDFEKIRHKASSLDNLYVDWRRLVNENLKAELKKLATLRARTTLDEMADTRARHLGGLVLSRQRALRAALQSVYGNQSRATLDGAATEETIEDRAIWTQIAAGTALHFVLETGRGQPTKLVFDATALGALLGTSINADEWAELDRIEVDKRVAACEERIKTLRHHTWEELCTRTEFAIAVDSEPSAKVLDDPETAKGSPSSGSPTPPPAEGSSQTTRTATFDQLIDRHLLTPLAKELVRKGFITDHFALYTSSYYGIHLGPDAREYVHRCIRPGEPDATHKLSVKSVRQILLDQGGAEDDLADIFEDPSIFNVSIVDYLLTERPGAAVKVAERLAAWGEAESEFVEIYCAEGARPDLLLSAMAPHWKAAVQYTAVSAPHSSENSRERALNAVLSALPTAAGYLADERVGDVVEATYRRLAAVTLPSDDQRAKIVFKVIATSGAILGSVGTFNDHAREVATAQGQYLVTEENLRELSGSASIALDELKTADARIYTHALRHLNDYLAAFNDSPATTHTIKAGPQFVGVVNDAASQVTDADLEALIHHACPCRVGDLTKIANVSWHHIMQGNRVDPTFSNVNSYIAEYGVDEALAVFLDLHPQLEWEEVTAPGPERVEVAVQIINARDVIPDVPARIKIAKHLQPGELHVDALEPESGALPARLIEAGLLADDAETFASSLMTDWETRESAIKVSTNYSHFINVRTLPVAEISKLLTSPLSQDIKEMTVDNLEGLLSLATRVDAQDIARALNANGWSVQAAHIDALIEREASPLDVTALIASNDGLDLDTRRDLLRRMGGDYARLADVGERPVFLPNDPNLRKILESLKGATVSSYDTDKRRPDRIRVNLHKAER